MITFAERHTYTKLHRDGAGSSQSGEIEQALKSNVSVGVSWDLIHSCKAKCLPANKRFNDTLVCVAPFNAGIKNKKLSYRRETAVHGALVLAKSGRMGLRDDIIGLSSTTVT